MSNTGMLVIISGPSGSGKGTVVKNLEEPNIDYALSISLTTRINREGEIHGKDYFFSTDEEFKKLRETDGFLEHAVFCGNMYGTPKKYVLEQIALGKAVILEIDVNGALQVKEKFKDCILIFLIPPTFEELELRLKTRNTESEETIKDRLRRAKDEIKLIGQYDYLVINDMVSNAVDKINNIVKAEYLKPKRNKKFLDEIKGEEENA